MNGTKKVIVAMSGGVDSSVAAALLRKDYQVIGVTMQIWQSSSSSDSPEPDKACCGIDAIEDARQVAYKLGIPHYVVDLREAFNRQVIDNFCHEYSQGRTPNPCIRCNQFIKFGALLEKATELGADYLATGHYARIEPDATSGRYILKKGTDGSKDQSYVLYALTQEQLRRTLFPLGNLTKKRVREIARELGLPVADKRESQEICFVPDNDYSGFLRGYLPDSIKPGPILDKEGNILGEHHGIISFTIGQRHGMGLAAREPLYITGIDSLKNAIIVGAKAETYGKGLIATDLNWISIEKLDMPVTLMAKIRYHHNEATAEVKPMDDGRVHIRFEEPQMAITPGQAVVFYLGDRVVGGGTIEVRKDKDG